MPADNSIYDTHAADWWNPGSFLYTLKTGLNPARFGYFLNVFKHLGLDLASRRVLEVGCGGGILSEEFARTGCKMSGVDLSTASLRSASRHARKQGLEISYLGGSAENLPYHAASFDLVVCCDVLEHVSDLNRVIAECARVLKPGGLYLFDTINRTPQSYVETILVAQELPLTRFFAPGTHAWSQFIRPEELTALFAHHGLVPAELTGLGPGISPLATLVEILRLKMGRIDFGAFGSRLKFHSGGSLQGSYIGYARRV